jgi:hypothetical protein
MERSEVEPVHDPVAFIQAEALDHPGEDVARLGRLAAGN